MACRAGGRCRGAVSGPTLRYYNHARCTFPPKCYPPSFFVLVFSAFGSLLTDMLPGFSYASPGAQIWRGVPPIGYVQPLIPPPQPFRFAAAPPMPQMVPRVDKKRPADAVGSQWKPLVHKDVPHAALAVGNVNATPNEPKRAKSAASAQAKPPPKPASPPPPASDTPSPPEAAPPPPPPKRSHHAKAQAVTQEELPAPWKREILAEGKRAAGGGRLWGVRHVMAAEWYTLYGGHDRGSATQRFESDRENNFEDRATGNRGTRLCAKKQSFQDGYPDKWYRAGRPAPNRPPAVPSVPAGPVDGPLRPARRVRARALCAPPLQPPARARSLPHVRPPGCAPTRTTCDECSA